MSSSSTKQTRSALDGVEPRDAKRLKQESPTSAADDIAAMKADATVATTLSSDQKGKMEAAQEIAKRHNITLKGSPPTPAMVLEVLTAVGTEDDWPKQTRLNVTDKPDGVVPGMCLGLVFGLGGGGAKASLISESYPLLANFIVRWCRATLPKTRDGNEFPFSSLQINYNYAAKKHVDGNNIGPSYIQSIGKHTGGKLWTADQGVIDCRNQWKLFDGNQEHATQPFKGTRISFIAFTHGLYSKLTQEVKQQLETIGFNACRTDGKDIPFFEAFRIEKSYLTDDHNQAFKEFRQQRAEADMPPPNHAGAIAVECYGRQAEKGGGWVSFASTALASLADDGTSTRYGEGVQIVDLKPNTTGVWCTEFAMTKSDGSGAAVELTLVEHQQFNLYRDLSKETRRLTEYVEELELGTVVVVSIADTACAKSRPLGPNVYEALEMLGASDDMPVIEYRQAWALIGFKGAAKGTAITAMGKRSTLLRLEATFDFDTSSTATGGTKLVSKKEDQTSIIDVVTGGGQDCAV